MGTGIFPLFLPAAIEGPGGGGGAIPALQRNTAKQGTFATTLERVRLEGQGILDLVLAKWGGLAAPTPAGWSVSLTVDVKIPRVLSKKRKTRKEEGT